MEVMLEKQNEPIDGILTSCAWDKCPQEKHSRGIGANLYLQNDDN